MSRAGIKFTVGSQTVNNPMAAMDRFTAPARQIKRTVGELTTVYDQIAPELINRIRNRFNSDYFGTPPMPLLGDKAREVRRSRGDDPDGPTLVSSGRLMNSIHRRPGPTKNEEGGQREVYILRIGSTGVPYAREVLEGSIWDLQVFWHEDGWFLIDHDNLERTITTNEREYTPRTLSFIQNQMTPMVLQVPVQARDFLQMLPEDERFIMSRVNDYMASMQFGDDSVLATLYG